MPPWAATVCERVGNTLVMQTVFRPLAASPKVARSPEPPAPTTTMSYSCSWILYADMLQAPNAIRTTARMLASATRTQTNLMTRREVSASHGVCT